MLPQEFTERMRGMLGEEYPAFQKSYEEKGKRSLRFNPIKGEKADFLEKCPFSLAPVAWEENGFYYRETDQPGKHPWHEAGVYYIQEASAMAPAGFLAAKPGERVLDLCAAPGGKSAQLGAAMRGKGVLVCNEIHPVRAKTLSGNVERMGLSNAVVTNEPPERLAERFPAWFDAVLVDAPCSGEGMFRKNEEAAAEWSPQNVEACALRQDGILDEAAKMLMPGGRLVYSTCTFAPPENEGSVSRFLSRHPDFFLEHTEKRDGMEGGRREWADGPTPAGRKGEDPDRTGRLSLWPLEETVRLWPHKLAGEGHFVALLRRVGTPGNAGRRESAGSRIPPALREAAAVWEDFAAQNLRVSLSGALQLFGEQLYLTPPGLPSLAGIRVLRPGLHLGSVQKGRFSPAHALALFLLPGQVCRTFVLPGEKAARDWIAGLTLPAEGEKGWYLVTVDGYSLGWGKLAGGQMKNHYPRGLRRNL